MSTLTEVAAGFMPENDMALLFLDIADTKRDLALLLAKFGDLVERKIDYEVFKSNASTIVLVRLVPQEAREATVMLGEAGISNFMVLFPRNKRQQLKTVNRCYGRKKS